MSLTRREFGALAAALAVESACRREASSIGPIVRRVERQLVGMATTDGAGVKLTRVIGQPALRNLDPFVMLDRFHSDDPDAYIRGFPDHPHRGFETITVMLDGRMRHKDSKGNHGLILGGGIQWMTAGRGIVHSEMPEQQDGLMSGFQLWLNLPAREKMRAQEYQDLAPEKIARTSLTGGGEARIVAGRALDVTGPVAPRTTEPMLLTLRLEDEEPVDLALPHGHTAFAFVYSGAVLVADKDPIDAGKIAIFSEGTTLRLRANGQRSAVLVAAAKPLREPIVQRGPFVMNTEAEIQKAFDDYRNGTLQL
jgi:redox-sensitive bicupin YhaK (pirin superfamily)